MTILTETDPRHKLTCTAALDQAYTLALAKLPEQAHGRLAKALALVHSGGVFETGDGHWEVASQREGAEPHHLSGAACDCDWQQFHPEERCSHYLAVLLQRKCLALLKASAQEGTAPAPEPEADNGHRLCMPDVPAPCPEALPEAPVSITLKACFDGHEVLVTLRGSTFARVQEQVEQASAWLQAHAPVPPAGERAISETHPCKYHGAMRASTKVPGTFYCTKKLADGSYCPSRFPEK
jgi:hypothetical protein